MSLTLEQVREAGRPARNETDGAWWRISFKGGTERVDSGGWRIGAIPRTGWHHLPGCDCRFCSDTTNDQEEG